MSDRTIKLPGQLYLRQFLLAALSGAVALGAAANAQAGDGNGKKYQGYYAPGYVKVVKVPPGHVRYIAPAPVYAAPAYIAPAPVVVYPTPVAYVPVAPAYPAYGGYPGGNVSIGINLPLR